MATYPIQLSVFHRVSNTVGCPTVGSARKAGVDACAKCSLALLAITASAIGDIEWHYNAISFLQQCHAGSKLLNYTHILVALVQLVHVKLANSRVMIYRM